MEKCNLKLVFRLSLVLFTMMLSTQALRAQLTGTKTIPTDYATIAAFVTDLNTQGVGPGGVTLDIPSGYSETAPAGGYTITATGTAGNPIVIHGVGGAPKPIITASASLTAGSLNDALFKIVGGDYITLGDMDLRENAANTTTAAATNNMTEWGIALLYASATDGAQRNTILNNAITLNRTYTNTWGIYSNTRHTATVVGTTADITAASGSNSFNAVYGNTISNVNMGIAFIGSSVVANMDNGNDIGGASLATGNTITNWGGASAASTFVSNSGVSYCIFMNHQIADNISYNTLTSAIVTGTSVTFRGIVKDYTTTAPTGTFTTNINNNTLTMSSGFTSGTFQHILSASITAAATATLNINNNQFLNSSVSGTASSSTIVGIQNSSIASVLNITGNTFAGWTSTATSGGATAILNSGNTVTTANFNNNLLGSGATNWITYSVASSGAITGISNSGGAVNSVMNMNSNDIRGIVYSVASSSSHTYFVNTGANPNTFMNNNTFTNMNVNTTGSVTFLRNNATHAANTTHNVNNNAIVTAYVKGGSGGTIFFYDAFGTSPATVTEINNGNNFSNMTFTGATISGWRSADGSATSPLGSRKTVTNNVFTNITNNTSGTTQLMYVGYSDQTFSGSNVTGNTISNINSIGNIVGIFCDGGSQNFNNNTISSMTVTGASGQVVGIVVNATASGTNNNNISGNTIFGLSSTNATTPLASAIASVAGTTTNITKNKIYNISATGAFTSNGAVSGILLQGGTTVNVYNNVIGQLTAPTANTNDAIRGISHIATGTSTTYRVYYNTIYLNATSAGANFGTSAIYHTANATATTATLDLRNNILINQSTAAGTGLTVVHRRSGNALANFATTSNRNMLFAGTPSATNLLMYDGTTPYSTPLAYLAAVNPRDVNSFTGEAFVYGTPGSFFISHTGTSPDFLKPVAGITTQAESGAANISTPAITDDYASVIRAGNAGYAGTGNNPDVGAYEFEAISAGPTITLNSVTPPATTQCTAAARLVSVNITTPTGTITGATIAYTVNGAAQTPITMTNTAGTTWQGTIPVAVPANAVITWAVAAQNSSGINGSYTGATYSDEPFLGATASITASSSTVCAGNPTSLTAKLTRNATVTLGAGSLATTGSGASGGNFVSPFSHYFGGYKSQYVIRASELQALGLAAGNLTSVAFDVTAAGTTYNGFTMSISHTAATVANTTFIAGTFTDVYSGNLPVLSTGINTITFTTPFNWDGTSNIIVQLCWSNNNTGGGAAGSAEVRYDATSFVSQAYYRVDSQTAAAVCGTTAATGTQSNRPKLIFTGNSAPAISSVSWLAGATPAGTGNPLSVSPTSTTTYTANIVTSGCTFSPAPTTTITVNPLPTAPTATNSGQCGAQVPTASVASTSGLPTPTFNWYAASSGGSALQSSTSTTYTSVVSTTTTFYVSELNTVTGCESARTAILVNVSSADPIAAVASPTTVCPGQSFTLTASNTAGTPFQNYSYSFQSATTGSGAETPVAGNPVTITPTVSGTMVYTVSGVDGGCAATNTVSVVVKPVPAITGVSATPATVCSGNPIALAASVLPPNGGTATLGTQTTTEFGGGVYRNGFGTGDFRHQLLYTAAEMTAAGFTAGDITALAFNVTSAGSGSANNYTIRLANTAVAGPLNATFQTGTFTTVYTAATYTAVAGINSHVFSTPFAWDGTSNILVDICYNISVIGGSSTLAATTPAQIMNTNLLGSAGACSATGGAATFANRPLIRFTMNSNAGYTWSWAPGTGLNTPSATTSIVNNTASPISQAFTVTATSLTTGCTNSVTTAAVTINPATVAPIATNSTQCGPGTPTASVTGTGTPGNTFQWFTVPTGGTAITGQTGSSLSGYSVSATTTFYVSEYNGSCGSARTPVTVTVTPAPSVSIAGPTTLCVGSTASLTASSSNDPNYTYTWTGGLGTGASVTASPASTTTYTVSAVDMSGGANNGCNTSAAITITVNPVPTGVTASASDNTICNGDAVTLTSTPASSPVTLLSQTFTGGFGTWTTTYSGTAPATTAWQVQNAPFTYTGSMNFTNFATPQGGGFAMTNADLGSSGLRTRAALQSPSFSTVGMNSATLTFQNLYQRWASGDSAVIVQASINGGSTWTTVKEYFALGVNQGDVTNNAQVMTNESITLAPGLMNQPDVRLRFYYVSSWGYYWLVDNIQLTGTPAPLTYAWTSSPAGYSSAVQNPPAPVTPAVTTTYTMTATNGFGCTASASTTVVVNQPTTSSTSVTACDSYMWTNGTTYNTSGTYTQTLTNAAGCDSVATLVLTINTPTTSSTSVTSCDSYTWTNNVTYNTSGTYTQMLTNSVGCDSIATLVLTINNSTTSSTAVTACNSYTWTDNVTYNASGTYTQTLTNAAGCDSVATLVLTITNMVTSSTSITACDSYTWTDNITYNTSGTYTQMLTSVQGCDSIATLVLTINNSTTSTTSATACESYTWTDNVTYTASGTYTQMLTNSIGCDSIATLVLTINNATSSTTTASACESYTWTDGNTYTASGTYTQLLMNANGCDSIATLVLTISGNPTATATDNGDLTITASAGTSYQWVHCATGLPIAGATSQTYTATVNGDYAVVVTNAGGCSDTSNCVTIDNIGISELIDASIKVFPNPTSGDVYVTMTAASATIDVVDAQGKLLQTVTVQNGEKVALSAYETGIYFLRIATENGSAVERIVKN